jgi:hypothetical protein
MSLAELPVSILVVQQCMASPETSKVVWLHCDKNSQPFVSLFAQACSAHADMFELMNNDLMLWTSHY